MGQYLYQLHGHLSGPYHSAHELKPFPLISKYKLSYVMFQIEQKGSFSYYK